MTHPIEPTNSRLTFQWWNEQNPKHIQYATQLWGNATVTQLIGGPFNQTQIIARFTKECQYWSLFTSSRVHVPSKV